MKEEKKIVKRNLVKYPHLNIVQMRLSHDFTIETIDFAILVSLTQCNLNLFLFIKNSYLPIQLILK